ncbi:hypothetical protein AAFF_G00158750 [Aldrovandia affinis]|uniref:Uncharacterized protein n=1 Tax=Aldrovandia affinis TaxID=143900 RepID=A0AAD7W808_9TELE|nr:hypothetical protein AAFF_G00158750 [Aldrovandia affinis]
MTAAALYSAAGRSWCLRDATFARVMVRRDVGDVRPCKPSPYGGGGSQTAADGQATGQTSSRSVKTRPCVARQSPGSTSEERSHNRAIQSGHCLKTTFPGSRDNTAQRRAP